MRSPQAPKTFRVSADYVAVVDPNLSSSGSDSRVVSVGASLKFRPRLPAGFVAYAENFPVTQDIDAVQTVSVVGSPTGGSWALMFVTNIPTADIPFNATPAQVQSALEALASVGAGNVVVTAGVNPYSYKVQFTKALGHQTVALLVGNAKKLTGLKGSTFAVTASNTIYGGTARLASAGVVIPVREGRLWQGRLTSIDVQDSLGVELVSDDPMLNLPAQGVTELIYDVDFTNVVWSGQPGKLVNFAFRAPKDSTGVCLTDPKLEKLPWIRP